jgi:radical SAM superfamily enzyme YgiQ (UPF0313 family)
MRLKLIYPEWGHFPLLYRRFIPVLGLATVAGLTPAGWDISFVDERIEPLIISDDADLVGISVMTPQALRAYEIADRYRALGIPVVLGGVHVSLAPGEASAHADAIVIGEAEKAWPDLLDDFTNGTLEKVYKCSSATLNPPLPRWDVIFDNKGYIPINPIQVSRGCPVRCDMCSVPQSFGTEFRMRNTAALLNEIAQLNRYIFIVNDNLNLAKRRTAAFLREFGSLSREWVGLAPLNIGGDTDFLSLLRHSNCWAMYIDLSPWISAGLNEVIDGVSVKKAGEYLSRIRDYGIKIIASFVFGFDHDNADIFDKTVCFAKEHGIEEAEFHILTPYPGSRLYDRLKMQGRLITESFSEYTTTRVVFRPARMTPDELYDGYLSAWKDFYINEYEDTPNGPLVRTFRGFPFRGELVTDSAMGEWVQAVLAGKGAQQ